MGRPKKPLQRRPNGIWCVQLWIGGKRCVKSLETRDPVLAHKRAGQAIEELEEEHRRRAGGSKWRANEPAIEYAVDFKT